MSLVSAIMDLDSPGCDAAKRGFSPDVVVFSVWLKELGNSGVGI